MAKVTASTMHTRSAPEDVPAPTGLPMTPPPGLPTEQPTNGRSAAQEPPAPERPGDLVVLRVSVQGSPSDAELQLLGRFLLEAAQAGLSPEEYYNRLVDMLDVYDKHVPEGRQS